MDSFSFDENDDVNFDALPSSTPKTTKRKGGRLSKDVPAPQKLKFNCGVCGKSYVSKYHFDRHVVSHEATATTSSVNITQGINVDESNVSLPSFVIPGPAPSQSSQQPFKRPSIPPLSKKKTTKPVVKPSFVCTYCCKGYVCSRSYKTHMRNHAMQDAAARFPDKQKVIENISDISVSALTKVSNAPVSEATDDKWRQLVGEIISLPSEKWTEFSISLCEIIMEPSNMKKTVLPSAYLSLLMDKVELFFSDTVKCKSILSILAVTGYDEDLLFQFLLEFSLNFVAEVLSFITKTFRQNSPVVPKRSFEIDEHDRQVIFYIAGSIMRGYLRIVFRYKSNPTWALIAQVLTTKILCDAPSQDTDAASTLSVDRGGLLYITSDLQKFFVALAQVVFSYEERNGSINFDKVITHVTNSELSVMWDEIIFDSLPAELSLNLMTDVVSMFCKTCGRGFAKRRLNFLRDKPVISMPTRHRVATRKVSG